MNTIGNDYAQAGTGFITPTWRGDLEHFRLLRFSMHEAGMGKIPHYAIINTEDMALFRDVDSNVTLVPTCEVLPAEVEQRRIRYNASTPSRRGKVIKRSIFKRTGLFPDANYYGWHAQQLAKLAVSRHLDLEVMVTLDSDLIFTKAVPAQTYVRDGQVVLFETPRVLERDLKKPDWYENACILHGLEWPRKKGDRSYDYVSHPFAFHRQTASEMLDAIEQRHQQPWWQALLAQPLGKWSEFMSYGVYVRQILQPEGLIAEPANQACRWLETQEQRENPGPIIDEAFGNPDIYYMTIQADHHGRFKVQDYESLVRSAISRRSA